MSGYQPDFSKSNNAVRAENDGLMVASDVSRKLKIPTVLIKQFCDHEEWHHTSKFYNAVEYYDPRTVAIVFGLDLTKFDFVDRGCDYEDVEPNADAIAALKNYKSSQTPETLENVTVEWLEWSGSRKHPSCAERREANCRVTIKGQTATITLSNGRTFQKRLSTNGFRITR